MTNKRSLDQSSFANKKARTSSQEQEIDYSILQLTGSLVCLVCDNDHKIEECIRTDINVVEYFNLAAIILDPSQLCIYPKSGKLDQLLRNSAGTLTTEEIQQVLSKIHGFIHYYSVKEIVNNIKSTLENYSFHKQREAVFVIGIINSLKKSLDSQIVERIKENDSHSLKDVLILNPRLSRLISLLALVVREEDLVSSPTPNITQITNEQEEEEVENSSSLSVIDITSSFNNDDDDDSYLILPVPSQVIPDSQTEYNSSQPCELFSQPSFNNDEPTNIPPPPPPPPNYDELSTDEIRAKVRSYGFKSANRSTMISYLEQLRVCTTISSASSSQSNSVDTQDTSNKVIQYLRSKEHLWMKILKYEPLDLDELYNTIDVQCKKSELKSILDEYGAIVKKPARVNKK